MRRYREKDADNARWDGFEFRPGDIVIAAPSKSGTTWTQLLVALLVFDGPDWPTSIGQMSPWMEQKTRSVDEVHLLLDAQSHRRFIKSHTPLDGVPMHDDVRYVCVGRDPRDAAVSMLHHGDNVDRERLTELVGQTIGTPTGSHEERLDRWIDEGSFPRWSARSLIEHYQTFWDRRSMPNLALFHFSDYVADLVHQVQRLAEHLEIDLAPHRAEELTEEASIEQARRRAPDIVPEAHLGVFKDVPAFLRGGRVGDGIDAMTDDQLARYDDVVSGLAPPDLLEWVHHGSSS